MPTIDQIVNVSISLATGALSRAGFGTLNIASFHLAFTDRIRFYSSTSAVADDFDTGSKEYLAAVASFAQIPRPLQVAISRLQVDAVTVDVVGSAVYDDTFTYTTTINGTDFTSVGAGTAILTATALFTAINLGSEPVTAVDNADGTYDLTADVVGTAFTLGLDAKQGFVVKTEGETWTDGLIAIRSASNEWYGLQITSRAQADVLLAAAWTETNEKLFGEADDDANTIDQDKTADTTTTMKKLFDLNYFRTFAIYHGLADGATNEQWIDSAVFGKNLTTPLDVQTSTWKFSQLAGITPDAITDTQRQNVLGTEETPTSGKNGNVYTTVGGANILQSGQVVSGEWIDTIIGRDWLQARMTERIFNTLIQAKAKAQKVPFAQKGFDTIGNDVSAALQTALNTNFLLFDSELDEALGYLVTVPKIADVSAADKAARVIRISFAATVAGAIHAVRITGTISI